MSVVVPITAVGGMAIPVVGGMAIPVVAGLALAAASPQAGIWPVAAGRLAAVLAILPLLGRAPHGWGLSPPRCVAAAVIGGCAALALVTYLLAVRHQMVSIAVVLSLLYPVIPVLLGLLALRERLSAGQALGLLGAGVAIGLISLG